MKDFWNNPVKSRLDYLNILFERPSFWPPFKGAMICFLPNLVLGDHAPHADANDVDLASFSWGLEVQGVWLSSGGSKSAQSQRFTPPGA